MGFFEDSILSV